MVEVDPSAWAVLGEDLLEGRAVVVWVPTRLDAERWLRDLFDRLPAGLVLASSWTGARHRVRLRTCASVTVVYGMRAVRWIRGRTFDRLFSLESREAVEARGYLQALAPVSRGVPVWGGGVSPVRAFPGPGR